MSGIKSLKIDVSFLFTNFKSEELIKKNIEIIEALNSNEKINFLVINNDITSNIKNVLNGLKNVTIVDNPSNYSQVKFENASYHHANAINFGVSIVSSRLLIIIDSDFFVIKDFWINDIFKLIEESNIAFFGAPYYPQYYTKYRYFPCAHLMAIDLNKIDKSELDFTPDLKAYKKRLELLSFFKIPFGIEKIFLVGKSKDTGYKVYEKFKKFKYYSLKPHYKIKLNLFLKCYSLIVPDKYSLYPKKKDSYTNRRHYSSNNKENLKQWEEYYYEDKLFSLHLRLGGNVLKNNNIIESYFKQLDKILIDKTYR